MKYFKNATNKVFGYEDDQTVPDGMVEISIEEKDVLVAAALSAKFDALSYAEKRLSEYPPIEDYIDGVVKGDQEQINAYIVACLAVKEKYPKNT